MAELCVWNVAACVELGLITVSGQQTVSRFPTLSSRSQEMNLCVHPFFSCCIYKEKASLWMYLERSVTE